MPPKGGRPHSLTRANHSGIKQKCNYNKAHLIMRIFRMPARITSRCRLAGKTHSVARAIQAGSLHPQATNIQISGVHTSLLHSLCGLNERLCGRILQTEDADFGFKWLEGKCNPYISNIAPQGLPTRPKDKGTKGRSEVRTARSYDLKQTWTATTESLASLHHVTRVGM